MAELSKVPKPQLWAKDQGGVKGLGMIIIIIIML